MSDDNMPPHAIEAELILRDWDRAAGLSETSLKFSSVDELYAFCVSAGQPHLIDRIVIRGHDSQDQPRILTFVFQSITVSPPPD